MSDDKRTIFTRMLFGLSNQDLEDLKAAISNEQEDRLCTQFDSPQPTQDEKDMASNEDQFIAAIKQYRLRTRAGLLEARDILKVYAPKGSCWNR